MQFRPVISHATGVWRLAGERHLGLIAAGVAFFAMLAIFPAVAALVSVVGLLTDPETVSDLMETASDFLPEEAFDLVAQRASTLASTTSGTLGLTSLVSLLFALWSARLGTGALAEGLTAIYGGVPRSGLKGILIALSLTLLLIGVGLIAITAMLLVPAVLAIISIFVDDSRFLFFVAEIIRWAVAITALVIGLGFFFRYGPNRPEARRSPFLSPGLFLALGLWTSASLAFTFYMSNFGNYDELYGSIGAAIILMLWFYMSAYAVLLGAALNHRLESGTRKHADNGGDHTPNG